VDFNSHLAMTRAHLGREGVRIKRAANLSPFAEQLPRVLGHVFLQAALRRSPGKKPQQEVSLEIQQLYWHVHSFQNGLDRALDCRNADAIKSHRQALHSGVKWIEGAATQEAQARGSGLDVVEDMMQEVDNFTWERLRDVDRVLQELAREERAAHHAACVMDLADEAPRS
jgi:hypothetical protein